MDEKLIQSVERSVLMQHFDANETLFLQRQLEQVRAKIFETEYPELKGRRLFPLATDIAASAETYVYFVYDMAGQAKVIANGVRSEEHTSELQSRENLVCRLLLEKKKKNTQ